MNFQLSWEYLQMLMLSEVMLKQERGLDNQYKLLFTLFMIGYLDTHSDPDHLVKS